MNKKRFSITRWMGTLLLIVGILAAITPAGTVDAAPNLVPAMPTNLQASDGTYTDKVYITWSFTPVSGQYVELWRSTSTASPGTMITSKNEFMIHSDTTATIGVTYYYRVRACDGNVCTNYTAWESGWRGLETPTNFQATDGVYDHSVGTAWNAVTGATKYEIYRAATIAGAKSKLGETTNLYYFDQTAPPQTSFYYFVRACTTSVQCSAYSTPDTGYRTWPSVANVQASDGTVAGVIRVTWDAIQGVDYYKVNYGYYPATNYLFHSQTSDNSTTLDITPPSSALFNVFQINVQPCLTSGGCGSNGYAGSDPGWDTGYAKPHKPTNVQAGKGVSPTNVLVTWEASAGTTSGDVLYTLYRATDATGTNLQAVASAGAALSDGDDTALPGVKYYYAVEACDANDSQNCSGLSTYDWGWATFTGVTSLSASDGGYSYVQLNWSSKANATSYKVWRAIDPGGPYSYRSNPTTNSYQDNSASEGVLYYYKVEACGSGGCGGMSSSDSGYITPANCYSLSVNHDASYASGYQFSPTSSLGCTTNKFVNGANVTVTVQPNNGWKVYTWSGTDDNNSTANSNTATMGASNKIVSVTYTPTTCYTLTLNHSGSGTDPVADLSNSLGCDAGKYGPGEIFGVDASPGPDTGWFISGWTGTRIDSQASLTNEVLMPEASHSVGINYAANCYDVIFSHTGQGSDPAPSPANSTGCAAGQYIYGEVISLTATPSAGWEVWKWSQTDNNSSTSTNNTHTVVGDQNVSVQYKQSCYTLTRSHTGGGSDPSPSPSLSTGCSSSGTFHMGEVISLTSVPDTGYQVSSWSGTSNNSSTSETNSFTMPASNHTVSVNYEQACYTLTLTHTGQGSDPVPSPANSTGCAAGAYHYNETITLTASPAAGWYTVNWNPNHPAIGPNQVQFSMPAQNYTGSVTYGANCYPLDLDYYGNGQQLTALPASSDGCAAGRYHPGEVITITAYPDNGYQVGSWSGTDDDTSKSTTNTLTMPESLITVSVTYVEGSTEPTFGDVPDTHPYFTDIEILYANGYTGGCSTSPLLFCPDVSMSRAQGAVFMLRGNFGSGYVPVTATHFFKDNWKNSSWGEGWAESMYIEGLTAGCSPSPLKFCPDDVLTNVQLAVFGMRLKYGMAYAPPAAQGTVFADMTDTGFWGTGWAEAAYTDGLIPSCGTDVGSGLPKFCPNALVSRGFGASVIVNAKNLTMP